MSSSPQLLTNGRASGDGRFHYDALVIGAGQAGGPLAAALAEAGRRVALIEKRHLGGTCVNVGCTPTKAMVASAAAAHLARRGDEFGIDIASVGVDMARVRRRKQAIVTDFREGIPSSYNQLECLDLICGHARFAQPRSVEINTAAGTLRVNAENVFIDVGSRPVELAVPGMAAAQPLDSTSIMELDRVPAHLLVVGGGYVGVEFAQMFRRFGSEVTILQRADQLLPREDRDIATTLEAILVEDGIDVITEADVFSANRDDAELELIADVNGAERRISGSDLLVATGRRPNTDDLGLDKAGVDVDGHGFIVVDEELRTSADGVWALGDVKGGPAFTHISFDDFRVVRDHLLGSGHRSTNDRYIPYTVYTDPQLGRVGMSEREAESAGRRVVVASMPAKRVARSIETGNTGGLWKALIDPDSEKILGAAILGQEGGEIMSVFQVAMMGGLSYKQLRDGVFAHPTYAEGLNNLFADIDLG